MLLEHAAAVKYWDEDIAWVYQAKIAAIIRERLLPGRKVIIQRRAHK